MNLQDRSMILEAATLVAAIVIGVFVTIATMMGQRGWTMAVGVVMLAGIAVYAMWRRVIMQPDQIRAWQSHAILEIANESLAHLRKGLEPETAQEVCRLALKETEAAAVAITDRTTVLGFAGVGEDHHLPGGPILTRATLESIATDELRVLESAEEIGCPQPGCGLKAAIVVPLEIRGGAVGSLKFYYTTPRLLNETQVTTVEGLGRLLSTQLELSELERQTELACRMELKALQSQIHPHFLFNTINTIANLTRTDPTRARELLREFAAFYRRTLESEDSLIPLETELEYVRRYLVFERARFGEGRIRFTEDVPVAALDREVPAFILQPLVENSVQHGIGELKTLHIVVSARVEGAGMTLRVSDDGRGIPAADLPRVLDPGFGRGLGIALKNVDDRLKGHFGPDSGLSIDSVEGEGTVVEVRVRPVTATSAVSRGDQ